MTHLQGFRKFKKEINKNFIFKKISGLNFNLIIFVCIFLVTVLYLAQINSVAAKGFQIKKLELKKEELLENNKKLELKIAELKSLSNLEERLVDLKMVSLAKNIDYISAAPAAVALNR